MASPVRADSGLRGTFTRVESQGVEDDACSKGKDGAPERGRLAVSGCFTEKEDFFRNREVLRNSGGAKTERVTGDGCSGRISERWTTCGSSTSSREIWTTLGSSDSSSARSSATWRVRKTRENRSSRANIITCNSSSAEPNAVTLNREYPRKETLGNGLTNKNTIFMESGEEKASSNGVATSIGFEEEMEKKRGEGTVKQSVLEYCHRSNERFRKAFAGNAVAWEEMHKRQNGMLGSHTLGLPCAGALYEAGGSLPIEELCKRHGKHSSPVSSSVECYSGPASAAEAPKASHSLTKRAGRAVASSTSAAAAVTISPDDISVRHKPTLSVSDWQDRSASVESRGQGGEAADFVREEGSYEEEKPRAEESQDASLPAQKGNNRALSTKRKGMQWRKLSHAIVRASNERRFPAQAAPEHDAILLSADRSGKKNGRTHLRERRANAQERDCNEVTTAATHADETSGKGLAWPASLLAFKSELGVTPAASLSNSLEAIGRSLGLQSASSSSASTKASGAFPSVGWFSFFADSKRSSSGSRSSSSKKERDKASGSSSRRRASMSSSLLFDSATSTPAVSLSASASPSPPAGTSPRPLKEALLGPSVFSAALFSSSSLPLPSSSSSSSTSSSSLPLSSRGSSSPSLERITESSPRCLPRAASLVCQRADEATYEVDRYIPTAGKKSPSPVNAVLEQSSPAFKKVAPQFAENWQEFNTKIASLVAEKCSQALEIKEEEEQSTSPKSSEPGYASTAEVAAAAVTGGRKAVRSPRRATPSSRSSCQCAGENYVRSEKKVANGVSSLLLENRETCVRGHDVLPSQKLLPTRETSATALAFKGHCGEKAIFLAPILSEPPSPSPPFPYGGPLPAAADSDASAKEWDALSRDVEAGVAQAVAAAAASGVNEPPYEARTSLARGTASGICEEETNSHVLNADSSRRGKSKQTTTSAHKGGNRSNEQRTSAVKAEVIRDHSLLPGDPNKRATGNNYDWYSTIVENNCRGTEAAGVMLSSSATAGASDPGQRQARQCQPAKESLAKGDDAAARHPTSGGMSLHESNSHSRRHKEVRGKEKRQRQKRTRREWQSGHLWGSASTDGGISNTDSDSGGSLSDNNGWKRSEEEQREEEVKDSKEEGGRQEQELEQKEGRFAAFRAAGGLLKSFSFSASHTDDHVIASPLERVLSSFLSSSLSSNSSSSSTDGDYVMKESLGIQSPRSRVAGQRGSGGDGYTVFGDEGVTNKSALLWGGRKSFFSYALLGESETSPDSNRSDEEVRGKRRGRGRETGNERAELFSNLRLTNLPIDVLQSFFQFLTVEEILHLQVVCTEFYTSIREKGETFAYVKKLRLDGKWARMDVTERQEMFLQMQRLRHIYVASNTFTEGSITIQEVAALVYRNADTLRYLCLHSPDNPLQDVTPVHAPFAFKPCTFHRLRVISLVGCQGLEWAHVFSNCCFPSVERFEITYFPVQSGHWSWQVLPDFTPLGLSGLHRMLDSMPTLERLTFGLEVRHEEDNRGLGWDQDFQEPEIGFFNDGPRANAQEHDRRLGADTAASLNESFSSSGARRSQTASGSGSHMTMPRDHSEEAGAVGAEAGRHWMTVLDEQEERRRFTGVDPVGGRAVLRSWRGKISEEDFADLAAVAFVRAGAAGNLKRITIKHRVKAENESSTFTTVSTFSDIVQGAAGFCYRYIGDVFTRFPGVRR